jgi:hypothetical protein
MALFLMKNKSMFYEHDLTYKLLNFNLENDHIQLEKAFDIYKIMFEPLVNLKPYDKIGIEYCSNSELFSNNTYLNSVKINFKLYLDKYKFYQSISRWYWNQKRQLIFDKLFIIFEEYKKIYDKVRLNELRNTKIFNKLLNDMIIFNDILIEKLFLLKKTYLNDSVTILIDKIIKIIEIPKEITCNEVN